MSPRPPDPGRGRAIAKGLRQIAARRVDERIARCAAAGLHCVRIDLAACRDKAAVLEAFASAFEFPEWFGGNWDALEESLADLEWLPAAGYALFLEGGWKFGAVAPDEWKTMLDVIAATAGTWRQRGVPFRAYVVDA